MRDVSPVPVYPDRYLLMRNHALVGICIIIRRDPNKIYTIALKWLILIFCSKRNFLPIKNVSSIQSKAHSFLSPAIYFLNYIFTYNSFMTKSLDVLSHF